MVYGRKYRRPFRGLRRRGVRRFGYGRRRLSGRAYVRSRLRRRYSRRSRTLLLSRGLYGARALLPDNAACKFKFFGQYNFTHLVQYIDLYANNPYDPIVGISTSSCSGYQQLMNIYNSCVCYGCRVSMKFYKMDNVLEVFGYCVMPDYENFSSTNVTKDFLVESPMNVKYRMLTSYLFNQQKNPIGCTMYRSIKGMFHKRELEPADFGSTRSGGPPSAATIRCGCCYASGPAEFSVRSYVTLTYYCKLFGRFQMHND